MRLINFTSLLLLFVLSSSSCENKIIAKKEEIYVENQSMNRIYASSGTGVENGGLSFYPDSSLSFNEPFLVEVNVDSNGIITSAPSISGFYQQVLPNDVLSVYIFDADQLDSLGWTVIRDSNLVVRRFDLTFNDVQAMDFSIVYQ